MFLGARDGGWLICQWRRTQAVDLETSVQTMRNAALVYVLCGYDVQVCVVCRTSQAASLLCRAGMENAMEDSTVCETLHGRRRGMGESLTGGVAAKARHVPPSLVDRR